jgi:hypothetical protein
MHACVRACCASYRRRRRRRREDVVDKVSSNTLTGPEAKVHWDQCFVLHALVAPLVSTVVARVQPLLSKAGYRPLMASVRPRVITKALKPVTSASLASSHWPREVGGGYSRARDTNSLRPCAPACPRCHSWHRIGWAMRRRRRSLLLPRGSALDTPGRGIGLVNCLWGA